MHQSQRITLLSVKLSVTSKLKIPHLQHAQRLYYESTPCVLFINKGLPISYILRNSELPIKIIFYKYQKQKALGVNIVN